MNQGAADTWGGIPEIVRALDGINGDFVIRLLLGPVFTHFEELAACLKGMRKKAEIFNRTDSVVDLSKSSDLAIMGAGNTLFELLSIGMPVIVRIP